MSRALKNPGYKGRFMPSFATQHARNDKPILVWKPGTQSALQQKRNLRSKARIILDSKDRRVMSVGQRVFKSIANEPDPEYSFLHLICAGLDASQETGEAWATCMTYLLDKFDHAAKEEHVEEAETRQGPSFLRRLLRAFIPGRTRPSHAASPEEDVNQPAGDGDGEYGHEGRSHPAPCD